MGPETVSELLGNGLRSATGAARRRGTIAGPCASLPPYPPIPADVGEICAQRDLRPEQPSYIINTQRQAEWGSRAWSFDDPRRVADSHIPGSRYFIVVSRPYLLTFHARNPKRIAWVVIGAYKTEYCPPKSR
jgi:hypothetical protein